MLEFYYDCLMKYLDWNDFQVMQTDTDSLYSGFSKDGYNKLQRIEGWVLTNDQSLVDIGIPTKIPKSL